MPDADEFGAELTGFRKRVAELRAARALPTGDRSATLDSALIELQYACDVLWPRYERLDAARRGEEGSGGRRERQLLTTVFQRLPVAVAVTDADGVVRRINLAASRLFGMRAGYATGRSLTTSFRHDGRAVLRSHIAAVARGEGDRTVLADLLPGGRLRVTMTGVRPSGARQSAVLAVFQPESPRSENSQPGTAPVPAQRRRPDPVRLVRHTTLMDLLDDVATALLTGRGAGGHDPLARACGVLHHRRFADWVIADAVTPGGAGQGQLARAVVLSPSDGGAQATAVAAADPAAAPLIREAVGAGRCVLRASPEDPHDLGGDALDGAPLLPLLEASSLLCVPLALPPGPRPETAGETPRETAGETPRETTPRETAATGTVLGVLTLVRRGGRRAFELAEAAAADRISRHVALALATAPEAPRAF